MNRRAFLNVGAAAGLASFTLDGSPRFLQPWTPGTLDIHHLAYGRGNAAFALCPDGTTILIDAGGTDDAPDLTCTRKPESIAAAGDWIASYLGRQMRAASRTDLDYAVATHIHPDHISALRGVDARVPIRKLIDRGYPDYDNPPPLDLPFTRDYLDWVKQRRAVSAVIERAEPGSSRQIRLAREAGRYPEFVVRNLAVNGEVWDGHGERAHRCFPELRDLAPADYPSENMCSIALRITYGKFDYYTGGDLTSDTEESGEGWRDIETPVARAAGPVDVAVANHHGYFDAVGAGFVRALRPRVFLVPTWYVAHPDILPLRRMLSRRLYLGDRDVFATCLADANRAVNTQYVSQIKSTNGHIIVRVPPGGEEFSVFVTETATGEDWIRLVGGPYRSRRSLQG